MRSFGIERIAAIEPGADELGMVMLARVFAHNARWRPTVRVVYSRSDGGATIDRLEYVPIDAAPSLQVLARLRERHEAAAGHRRAWASSACCR